MREEDANPRPVAPSCSAGIRSCEPVDSAFAARRLLDTRSTTSASSLIAPAIFSSGVAARYAWSDHVSAADAALGGFERGAASWQLGVFDGEANRSLQRPDGSLVPFGGERRLVHLFASDDGTIEEGTPLRVVGQLADGALVEGPVFAFHDAVVAPHKDDRQPFVSTRQR